MSSNQDQFTVGQVYNSFKCIRIVPLPDLRADALEFEHVGTGAKLLHMHTEDIENCFATIFPTPPPDETGLPHILEHSTLGGSEKYPLREPFFELIKTSMATFINAFTAQCFTAYPVCTTVEPDYFNLANVYMDAIFHPNLTRDTFRREGHHLALKDNSDLNSELIISGIVYSEMKGYWSTPDNMLSNLGTRGLFPDTPLGRDSGGDPSYIPTLSYEQFKDFHATYYHPSNAHFYLYGNIPTIQHLEFIEPLLASYTRKDIDIFVPRQKRWSTPKTVERTYPVGANEDDSEQSYIVMNWLVDDATAPDTAMAWSVLSTILLGHDAAPLKKTIIDAKLGADMYSSGDFSHSHELVFDIGIQGSKPENVKKFEELVMQTLENIANSEISPEAVDTAFHQQAYQHLEVEKNFPLKLLWLCGESWPYKKDPLSFMNMKKNLADCRESYNADPLFFNNMIHEKILKNNHRITVAIHPERDAETKAEQEFAQEMATKRARFSSAEIASIAEEAAALSASQTQANTPEQLASLPQLNVNDLPEKPRCIPTTVSTLDGITILRNDIFTNGINYFGINIDLSGMPQELYAALPRFTKALTKMGTNGQTFAQVAEKRAAVTGSMNFNASIQRHAITPEKSLRHLHIGMKTIDNKADAALDLLHDIIFDLDPSDTSRLKDIMIQAQTHHRTELIHNAMPTAMRRASRGITPESALTHIIGGRDALALLNQQLADFDKQSIVITRQIEQLRNFLCDRTRWTISFTGSDSVYTKLERSIQNWIPLMTNAAVLKTELPFTSIAPPREGLAAPIKVAHCAKVMAAPGFSDPDTPLYELGLYLSNFDYMLPQIRFKGNAYGAGCQYNPQLGTLSLFSYNDPHITETLAVFDNLSDFVHNANWSQTDIDRAIIGSAKKIVQPIRPAEATSLAMVRHIRGETDELHAKKYEATRTATPATIKETLLKHLEQAEPQAGICVSASREHLEEANKTLGRNPLEISDILGENKLAGNCGCN